MSLLQKRMLRQQAKQIRNQLNMHQLSEAIVEQICAWPCFQNAQVVLTFAALPGEVNLLALRERFPEKTWYLPRVAGPDRMTFHHILPNEALVVSSYGILEPSSTAPQLIDSKTVDLVLVPGLMLDRHGTRLGFGKGYYDRFMVDLPEDCPRACPIPSALWVDKLPADPWDIPVTWAITEFDVQALGTKTTTP